MMLNDTSSSDTETMHIGSVDFYAFPSNREIIGILQVKKEIQSTSPPKDTRYAHISIFGYMYCDHTVKPV